jgi:hypothetical protein
LRLALPSRATPKASARRERLREGKKDLALAEWQDENPKSPSTNPIPVETVRFRRKSVFPSSQGLPGIARREKTDFRSKPIPFQASEAG